MKYRTFFAICIATLLIFSAFFTCVNDNPAAFAQDESEVTITQVDQENLTDLLSNLLSGVEYGAISVIDDDQNVDVIINMEQASALELANKAGVPLSEFVLTDECTQYTDYLLDKQIEVMNSIAASGIEITFKYSFTSMVNAIAANVKYGDLDVVGAVTGVQSVCVSEVYSAPDTANSAIQMNLGTAREELGYTGAGTAIAMIDTGLNFNHYAFINSVPNPKITLSDVRAKYSSLAATSVFNVEAYGYTYQRVYSNAQAEYEQLYYSTKIPFQFDYGDIDYDASFATSGSSIYHGTHTAGIAAGYDRDAGIDGEGFKGVAYEAQLLIMKVINKYSSISTIDILAAVNDAVVLGVDAINISIGSASGFAYEEYADSFYQFAEDQGVIVSISAGNSYSAGVTGLLGNSPTVWDIDYGVVGSPSSYSQALSVASSDTYLSTQGRFLLNGEKIYYNNTYDRNFYDDMIAKYGNFDGDYEYVVIPGLGDASDYEGLDVSGKIALVQRGSSSFSDKIKNAAYAGAIACIIWDNVDGAWINMSIAEYTIPGIFIYMEDGQKLVDSENNTVTFSKEIMNSYYAMSDFSSIGCLSTLELKPEITAPGGLIVSSTFGYAGYETYSGTSMAAPNIAGSVAVVKQYLNTKFPNLTAKEKADLIYGLIMSTSNIMYDGFDVAYSPRKQGAGLIDVSASVTTTAYITVDGNIKPKIELGDDPLCKGVYDLKFNVVNFGETDLTYTPETIVLTAESRGMFYTLGDVDFSYDCTFDIKVKGDGSYNGETITVSAGKTASITVTITLGDEARAYMLQYADLVGGNYVEGFVSLKNTDENGVDLNVPYLGFFGDWTTSPMFDYTVYDEESYLMSTYYGALWGYYSTYYMTVMLGTYCFTNAQPGYEIDNITGYTDKCAIAPNGNGYEYIMGSYIGLFHNMDTLYYTITDAVTGEEYYYEEYYAGRKSATNYSLRVPHISTLRFSSEGARAFYESLPNNTELILTITGITEFEAKYPDRVSSCIRPSVSFGFAIDNELPQLIGASIYEEDGKYYLTADMIDNRYILSVMPFSIGGSGDDVYFDLNIASHMYAFDIDEKGAITTATWELGLIDKVKDNCMVGFVVYDYAFNISGWVVRNLVIPESAYANDTTDSGGSQIWNEVDIENSDVDDIAEVVDFDDLSNMGSKPTVNSEGEDFVIDENGVLIAYNGNDEEVVIPENVVEIGANAFFGNTTITSLTIPEGVVIISESAFMNAVRLKTLSLPSTLEVIGIGAFMGCSIKSITFTESTTPLRINTNAFYKNSLKTIELPDNVYYIGDYAFSRNKIFVENFVLPENIEHIGSFAFDYAVFNQDDLIIPEGCTYCGEGAFFKSVFKNVYISSTVTTIDFGTHQMFEDFVDVNYIITEGNARYFNDGDIVGDIYGNYLRYQGECSWSTCITIPEKYVRIAPCAFYGKKIGLITVPETIKAIGEKALYSLDLCLVVFEGKRAPILEYEEGYYQNFAARTWMYYPENGSNYLYSYYTQNFYVFDYTQASMLEIYSLRYECGENDTDVRLYGFCGPWIEGIDVYKGTAEENGEIEYSLIATADRYDENGELNIVDWITYANDSLELFVPASYYVQAWMTVDGVKVYGTPSATIIVTAQPTHAYYVVNMIDVLDVHSSADAEKVLKVREAYDALTELQASYVTNYEKLVTAEKKVIAYILNDDLFINYDVTLEDEEVIVALRERYTQIEEENVSLLTNAVYLRCAEMQIELLKLQEANNEALEKAQSLSEEIEKLRNRIQYQNALTSSCGTVGNNGGGIGGTLLLTILAAFGAAIVLKRKSGKDFKSSKKL
ncbi:MAG: S8 family serine peptidase [Clostridia bacterium]|nr:S8 family serine peptidase [Clostridia bacterium]